MSVHAEERGKGSIVQIPVGIYTAPMTKKKPNQKTNDHELNSKATATERCKAAESTF